MWKEVEMSGDCWKADDSVFVSILYTHVITVSSASTTDRPKLLAIVILSHCCPFGTVFALILFKLNI